MLMSKDIELNFSEAVRLPDDRPDCIYISTDIEQNIKYTNSKKYCEACIDAYKEIVKPQHYDCMVVEGIKQIFEN